MRYLRCLFALSLACFVVACSSDTAPSINLTNHPAEDDGVVVLDPDDFELEYRFQCQPLNCNTECRFGGEGDWFDCDSPEVFDQDSEELDLEEGTLRFEVRATKTEQSPSSPDVVDLLILFDYDFELDDTEEYVAGSPDSPFYFPGEFSATCERDYGDYAPDDCELNCRWESDQLEDSVEADCPLNEPFDVEFPDDELEYAFFVVEACADHFDDDHCKEAKTYLFYPSPPEWTQLATGTAHTCGIVEDGSLWCWGRNDSGQLGVGDTQSSFVAQHVDDGPWQDVSAGDQHTCALDDDGALYCWGSSSRNRLGTGELEPGSFGSTHEPIRIHDGPWLTVSAGGSHTCALSAAGSEYDGDLVCWGGHGDGQVGSGSPEIETSFRSVPLPVATLDSWADVEAADRHTCGLAVTGSNRRAVHCWGSQANGRLGNNVTSDSSAHTAQETRGELLDADAHLVSSLTAHSCAIATIQNTKSYCWGDGGFGRLGIDSTSNRPTPGRVENGEDLVDMAAGGDHTCAVRDDGELLCWGDNIRGQAGIDDDGALVPVTVETPDDVAFSSVVAGNQFSCGIDVDGVAYCWGTGSDGRLGSGSSEGIDSPTKILWPQAHFIPDPSEAEPHGDHEEPDEEDDEDNGNGEDDNEDDE